MTVLIEARDIALAFGETPALRGASLSVNAGEVLAIMGPSGSGKSTLLHCLAGILTPDSGEVHFNGQRIDTMQRQLWYNSGSRSVAGKAGVDPLWWHFDFDYYTGKEITEFEVAPTGPTSPIIASTLPLLRRITGPEAARNG